MTVAVLYIDPRGPYPKIAEVDAWDSVRDASRYEGPHPVVAHPPCGPWGRLRHLYKGDEHALAPIAVDQVRRWGGALEHPAHSLLWKHAGLPLPGAEPDEFGGYTIAVNQVDWGHVARKATWLYLVGVPREALVFPPPGTPTHWIGGFRYSEGRKSKTYRLTGSAVPPGIKVCSAQQRRRTPLAFASWLIDLARRATTTHETSTTSKATPMTLPQNRKILGYRRHPAAAVWPMLEEDELAKLVESIKARGLLNDIELITVDGETWILDGSNRAKACEIAGIKPRFTKYTGKRDIDSLLDHVDARNDARRHTTKSVRAMIAAESAKLRHGERQTGSAAGVRTQAEAAKGKDVSERLVRKAVKVRDEATPKIKEAVMRGKLTVEAAEVATGLTSKQQDELADRAIAKGGDEIRAGHVRSLVKQEGKREIIRKINTGRVAPMPMGPFGLIYGDYPWKYDNADQHEGSRGHMGYPPMSMDEVIAHAREAATRAAPDCVIALWFTNAFLHEVGRVLAAYGAQQHTAFTWPKPRAGVGTWGRGQTEHLIIASIGSPVHTLNEVSTLLAPYALREHSRKPDEVAELLAKHCSGPFLELFAREPREGWTPWGAEPAKFEGEAAAVVVVEPKRKSKILTATDARMGTGSPA